MMNHKNLEKGASTFTEAQAEYLAGNLIGRLAMASATGQPHVVPVTYSFEGRTIAFRGWNLDGSLKFRNLTVNPKVAFVVDEVASVKPWRVRGVEVRGRSEPIRSREGVTGIRIIPVNIRSWGLGD